MMTSIARRATGISFVMAALTAAAFAQQAAPRLQTPSNPRLPTLFFTETWKQTGLERNVDNDVLTNPNLELHLYGATSKQIQIAPTTPNNRQDPPNLWTGICQGPVAATLGWISCRPPCPEARRRHVAHWRSRRRRRYDRELHRDRVFDRLGPVA